MILFSSYKKTDKVEKERNKLLSDYNTYTATENSEKLKTYLSLKEKVEATSFKKNRNEIESLRFKGSGEQRLEEEFQKLQRNSKIKTYYNVLGSENLKRYNQYEQDGSAARYEQLRNYIKSGGFKQDQKAFKSNKQAAGTWETSEAAKKYKEFQDFESRSDFQLFLNFKNSKNCKIYLELKNSSTISRFEELKKELASESFKNRKEYLLDTKRYEKTEDYAAWVKYEELKKDTDIQLYFKYRDTDAFKFFRNWKKTFDENFEGQLDTARWNFLSPIEQAGPGQPFTPEGYYHYNNGEKNIEIKGNVLTISVLRDNAKGLYWDKQFGFIQKEFDTTSSMIHSFGAFKQQYGYFDIKLKAPRSKGVISTVALVDEEEDNAIMLFSSDGRRAHGGIITTNKGQKEQNLINLKYNFNGYIIIGMKWTPEKVEWKVNGTVMGTIARNLPHSKLGLRLGCEVNSPTSKLPYRLDIDFIRCYTRNL